MVRLPLRKRSDPRAPVVGHCDSGLPSRPANREGGGAVTIRPGPKPATRRAIYSTARS